MSTQQDTQTSGVVQQWRPRTNLDQPRELTLTIEDIEKGTFTHGPAPIISGVDPGGRTWTWFVFGEIAQAELAACDPDVGVTIIAKYVGQPAGKDYYVWKVRRADGRGKRIDWSKYGAKPVEAEPPQSDVPAEFDSGYGKPPKSERQTQPKDDGDDIPF